MKIKYKIPSADLHICSYVLFANRELDVGDYNNALFCILNSGMDLSSHKCHTTLPISP